MFFLFFIDTFHSSGAKTMGLAYLSSLLKNLSSLNQAADLILRKYVRIICF